MEIGFIGAGRMASAVAKGMLAQGFSPQDLACASGSGKTARALAEDTQIQFFDTVNSLAESTSVWVLGLKPFQLSELPEELSSLSQGRLIISMLAGVKLEKLQKQFPNARNWVRIMPNTPSQIGQGVTGISYAHEPEATDRATVDKMLRAVGSSVTISEDQMDALTAVSGSGVAYVFEWASAMIEAGQALGLSSEVAQKLTLDTFFGASALMKAKADKDPSALRDAVVSKGGTTEAALKVFAEKNTRAIISAAMTAAADRSKELSK